MSISVLVPSRGRPESMRRLVNQFAATCKDSTYLHCIVDADDPSLAEYTELYEEVFPDLYRFFALWVAPKGPPGIVHPVNWVTDAIFRPDFGFYPTILGFMGDDHLPQTQHWDFKVESELRRLKTGVAYGDDLLQGQRLATAAFLTADIVQTLGYMAPPELYHLYVDDFWMYIGKQLNRLQYMPSVVIEHLHYLAGKAEVDETYKTVNASPLADHDRTEFAKWKIIKGPKAIKDLRGLL